MIKADILKYLILKFIGGVEKDTLGRCTLGRGEWLLVKWRLKIAILAFLFVFEMITLITEGEISASVLKSEM